MSFKEIYGHRTQIDLLKQSLYRNRVAHAYLFYGMSGVGKKTTALAFAQALNCRCGEIDGCGSCPSCRKIAQGTHPDLVILKPQGIVIKIGDIRQMQEQMQFHPFEDRRRVVIIEKAHRMNEAAANALLKTLEEPMPYNVLILLTSSYDGLPKTILSRCQKIRFNPLRPEIVRSYLIETGSVRNDEAAVLAAASQGSIGRILAPKGRDRTKFGAMEKIGALNGRDALSIFSIAQEFGNDRESILEQLGLLREWFRDVMVMKETGSQDFLVRPDLSESTASLAKRLTVSNILDGLEAIAGAVAAIERNANKQLTLESMIFTLSYLTGVVTAENSRRTAFGYQAYE